MIGQRLQAAQEASIRAAHRLLRPVSRMVRGPKSEELVRILDELTRTGVSVVSPACADALQLKMAPAFLAQADALTFEKANRSSAKKSYTSAPPPQAVAESPEVLAWPLTEPVVELVRAHIGLPIKYRGVQPRSDRPDGQKTETRLWHVDGEDSHILKIIVYLTDVGAEDGPFTFVPRNILLPGGHLPRGRIEDATMDAVVDPASYRQACGPRGTIIFADTCSIYHKGAVPKHQNRRALFYAFNSAMPVRPAYCAALQPWDRMPIEWMQRWRGLLSSDSGTNRCLAPGPKFDAS